MTLIVKKRIKNILELGIPAIIENILRVFIGVVDIYFVGKLGTKAIAGVGVTNLTMNVYIAFFFALGVGMTAMVSRFKGQKDPKALKETMNQGLMMSILVGVVICLVNLFFAKDILKILGAESGVIEYALPYFRVVAIPAVFLSMNMVLSSALRGYGDTKTPMRIAFYSNVINGILDYILIFGIFSWTGLGIVGAALATTLAE